MRLHGLCIGAVLALALSGCAAAEQPQMAEGPVAGAGSSLEKMGSVGSATVDEDATYVNATYGFAFDPSFCPDLTLVEEARDAAVFESESWGMRLYVQAAENTEGYDAQGLADAIALQAEVPDGDPVVGEGYCVVQQLERDFETGEDVVVTYTLFVGEGNWQGLVCEFAPEGYEALAEEQGTALVAAFLPGDLTVAHEEMRQGDVA